MSHHEVKTNILPPIDIGTKVMTFIDKNHESDYWTHETKKSRKHKATGIVTDYHDSCGIFFDVKHEDGIISSYDLHELIVVEIKKDSKSCPCEWGLSCHEMCTCANPFLSGGCKNCCKYGSEEQQKKSAEIIHKKNQLLEAAVCALQTIEELGGNLSDESLTSRTGPNDAVARGIMYTGARKIANAIIYIHKELKKEFFHN